MLFQDALNALKEGKTVARESWTPEDGYLILMAGMHHVWKVLTIPVPNAGNHIFSFADMQADDWKEVNRDTVPCYDMKSVQKAS